MSAMLEFTYGSVALDCGFTATPMVQCEVSELIVGDVFWWENCYWGDRDPSSGVYTDELVEFVGWCADGAAMVRFVSTLEVVGMPWTGVVEVVGDTTPRVEHEGACQCSDCHETLSDFVAYTVRREIDMDALVRAVVREVVREVGLAEVSE